MIVGPGLCPSQWNHVLERKPIFMVTMEILVHTCNLIVDLIFSVVKWVKGLYDQATQKG